MRERLATSDIYYDLHARFVLSDRHRVSESALDSAQEALEVMQDVVRDLRSVLLEAAIVVLIPFEVVRTRPPAFERGRQSLWTLRS